MRTASQAKREAALNAGIPKGYREVEEGEYVNNDCWYLDGNGGQRKSGIDGQSDLHDLKGGFRYRKEKHQVIIRPIEDGEAVHA